MIKGGTYILQAKGGDLVPCSDASGEVEEVGDRVTLFKKVFQERGEFDIRVIGCVPFSIKDTCMGTLLQKLERQGSGAKLMEFYRNTALYRVLPLLPSKFNV